MFHPTPPPIGPLEPVDDVNNTRCDWGPARTFYSFFGSVSIVCIVASLYVYIVIEKYKVEITKG